MSWIKTIDYKASTGQLRRVYDRVKGPDGYIDNILEVHSLRPHTLAGHMTLYKNVLHHTANTVPKWLLETLGVYVSLLNGCAYCVEHHFVGLCTLLQDDARAQAIRHALERGHPEDILDEQACAALGYAAQLTRSPDAVEASAVASLRHAGLDDGQILEINQVVGYFAYANRTVLGLGVTTEGDILGLSPSSTDDAEDWHHR